MPDVEDEGVGGGVIVVERLWLTVIDNEPVEETLMVADWLWLCVVVTDLERVRVKKKE